MIKKNGRKIAAIAIAATLAGQNLHAIFALDNVLKEEQPVVVEKTDEKEPTEDTSKENTESTPDVEKEPTKDTTEEAKKEETPKEEVSKEEPKGETVEATEEKANTNNKITILHTNDMHGRFQRNDKVIGLDVVAAIKNQTKNSILVDAGDTTHGLPFVTLSKGQDALDLLNATGYEYMAPGNHDFNYGYERLLELFQNAKVKSGSTKLRPLAGNIKKNGESLFKPSAIKVMNVNGKEIKVGFFGMATEETSYKTHPNNVKGLDFEDPRITAKAEVKNLKSQGADVIIALGHIGVDESSEPTSEDIIRDVDGIDVFVDGHSHTAFKNGKKVNNTMLVSTGEYLSNLGKVEIEFDENNKVVDVDASLINKSQASSVTPDPEVESMMKKIEDEQKAALSVKVGKTETHLEGSRDKVRFGETNLGNLITDAMLNETGADVSLTNGGGIRSSIAKGDITKGDIVNVLPFGNFIVTKKLTGAQIKEVLEFGVENYGVSFGGFPHVGGMKYVVDPKQPIGKRIVSLKVNGKNIDMDKTYTVATNDFTAAGGDDYPVFAKLPIVNEYSALNEALENYIKKLGTVNYKESEGRITTGKKADFEESESVKPEEDKTEENKPQTNKPNNNQGNNNDKTDNPKTGDISLMSYVLLGGAAFVGLRFSNMK
ncbi:5'-nucleotidase C-terminal domain-containing protein [[Clostridium] dakarense]|uniref:5'-nucleotidase C-terminal domain-containing protein n=1 Tax=Faecalimicrobium dakarense TaxID=1301100 RepID=UPI0004B6DCA0|nr:5'-nucleotidase C-terminal domain-containing protein [[Clostridium] dakarense]